MVQLLVPSLPQHDRPDEGRRRRAARAISFGPAHLEEHHPDLFWYGVHPVEALYTAMGTGCVSVVRTHTENTDVVTGLWDGGKVGTLADCATRPRRTRSSCSAKRSRPPVPRTRRLRPLVAGS